MGYKRRYLESTSTSYEKESLIKQPEIIALVCAICVVTLALIILSICFCRKRKSRDRTPERTCRCYPMVPYDHHRDPQRGHYDHPPPPAYSPSEMHGRPFHRHCHCQPETDSVYHLINGQQAIPRDLGQGQGAYENRDAFPLLQQTVRNVANPVFVEDDSIDITHGPLKDLYKRTERSFSQTVCGKLLVSVARCVDHRGDTLFLDNMGISLEVPPGAVKRGQTQWMTLVLNWDLSDNPHMEKDQSLVSPVVYVGPHGLKLEKPCVLSYRHCAFDTRQIQVMRSETELTNRKAWEALCDRSEQSDKCYLTQDECRINVDKFTLYTCVQSPLDDQVGKKWLQIAVFACPLRREINHHQIRVYFLNKTPCALQWAIQNEAGFGGKLMCPEKVFLFDGGDFDMVAKTKYISDGWELVDMDNLEKISFLSIWHGQCPHISVCYKRRPLAESQQVRHRPHQQDAPITVAIELSLHLLTFQRSLEDRAEKIFIQVAEDNITPVTENELACRRHHIDSIEINVNSGVASANTSAAELRYSSDSNKDAEPRERGSDTLRVNINTGPCSVDFQSLAKNTRPRILCHELRHKLIMLLDPVKQINGNDWRSFAEILGYDSCIPKLEATNSPTENLLNIVESKSIPLSELKRMFEDMNRTDCVQTLDEYMVNGDTVEREPDESSYSGCVIQSNPRNVSSQMSWDVNTNQSRSYTNQSRSGHQQSWTVASSSDNNLSQTRSRENSSLFSRGFMRVDAERASTGTQMKQTNCLYDRQNVRMESRTPEENSYNSARQGTVEQNEQVTQYRDLPLWDSRNRGEPNNRH